MHNLKERLLETNLFIDNEWLNKYVELVETKGVIKEKFKTQRHHKLQEAYFNHFNLPVDNSDENVVDLLYKDHILAHYYLMKCTTDWLKWSNQSCFWPMTGRKNIDGLDELLSSLDGLRDEYEEFCKKDSELNSGELNGNYGNKWSNEKKYNMSIQKQTFYNSNEGRLTRDKLSRLRKGVEPSNKGKKAFYSLTEEKVIYDVKCPKGYTNETPQWYLDQHKNNYFKNGNTLTKGFVWYTNGIDNIFCLPENKKDGYYKGRICKKK